MKLVIYRKMFALKGGYGGCLGTRATGRKDLGLLGKSLIQILKENA